jgi:hypothetical protein
VVPAGGAYPLRERRRILRQRKVIHQRRFERAEEPRRQVRVGRVLEVRLERGEIREFQHRGVLVIHAHQ